MEKTDRVETHDFMNVESFSQLPFIRPSQLKEKSIRLFGKEFGGGGDSSAMAGTAESDSAETTAAVVQEETKESVGESNRKFECHYCCRNFPTSQALGGHQNAHKRERQHAKRAHLQSAMVHSSFSEAQMYGLMNYHRFTTASSTPSPPYHHHHHQHTTWGTTNNPYCTTSSTSGTNTRFYGGNNNVSYRSNQTPINGSPLALWRIPTSQSSTTFNNRDRFLNPSPLLSTSDDLRARMGTVSTSQSRYLYESKTSVQDQVSLDLHL